MSQFAVPPYSKADEAVHGEFALVLNCHGGAIEVFASLEEMEVFSRLYTASVKAEEVADKVAAIAATEAAMQTRLDDFLASQ